MWKAPIPGQNRTFRSPSINSQTTTTQPVQTPMTAQGINAQVSQLMNMVTNSRLII
jgi:hypothetical protein